MVLSLQKELDAIKDLTLIGKEGIGLLAITIDNAQQLNKVKPLIQQKGWSYQVLSDINSESLRVLSFQTIPQTFIVNQEGMIIYSHSGYSPGDEFELEKKLKSLNK
ncbi:MAG: redoxin domain-containing protein [Saprospiraceae bacterium]|nr:redoxin domain-containing protein [Saprospiraceae bacterium]